VGIKCIGTLDVLLLAKEQALIGLLKPLFEDFLINKRHYLISISPFLFTIQAVTCQKSSGLRQLTSVRGLDIINTTKLENLNGLENLTSILGRVLISGNSGLKDLSGLSGFTSLVLEIENNAAL
jgi:hypothetical protein